MEQLQPMKALRKSIFESPLHTTIWPYLLKKVEGLGTVFVNTSTKANSAQLERSSEIKNPAIDPQMSVIDVGDLTNTNTNGNSSLDKRLLLLDIMVDSSKRALALWLFCTAAKDIYNEDCFETTISLLTVSFFIPTAVGYLNEQLEGTNEQNFSRSLHHFIDVVQSCGLAGAIDFFTEKNLIESSIISLLFFGGLKTCEQAILWRWPALIEWQHHMEESEDRYFGKLLDEGLEFAKQRASLQTLNLDSPPKLKQLCLKLVSESSRGILTLGTSTGIFSCPTINEKQSKFLEFLEMTLCNSVVNLEIVDQFEKTSAEMDDLLDSKMNVFINALGEKQTAGYKGVSFKNKFYENFNGHPIFQAVYNFHETPDLSGLEDVIASKLILALPVATLDDEMKHFKKLIISKLDKASLEAIKSINVQSNLSKTGTLGILPGFNTTVDLEQADTDLIKVLQDMAEEDLKTLTSEESKIPDGLKIWIKARVKCQSSKSQSDIDEIVRFAANYFKLPDIYQRLLTTTIGDRFETPIDIIKKKLGIDSTADLAEMSEQVCADVRIENKSQFPEEFKQAFIAILKYYMVIWLSSSIPQALSNLPTKLLGFDINNKFFDQVRSFFQRSPTAYASKISDSCIQQCNREFWPAFLGKQLESQIRTVIYCIDLLARTSSGVDSGGIFKDESINPDKLVTRQTMDSYILRTQFMIIFLLGALFTFFGFKDPENSAEVTDAKKFCNTYNHTKTFDEEGIEENTWGGAALYATSALMGQMVMYVAVQYLTQLFEKKTLVDKTKILGSINQKTMPVEFNKLLKSNPAKAISIFAELQNFVEESSRNQPLKQQKYQSCEDKWNQKNYSSWLSGATSLSVIYVKTWLQQKYLSYVRNGLGVQLFRRHQDEGTLEEYLKQFVYDKQEIKSIKSKVEKLMQTPDTDVANIVAEESKNSEPAKEPILSKPAEESKLSDEISKMNKHELRKEKKSRMLEETREIFGANFAKFKSENFPEDTDKHTLPKVMDDYITSMVSQETDANLVEWIKGLSKSFQGEKEFVDFINGNMVPKSSPPPLKDKQASK